MIKKIQSFIKKYWWLAVIWYGMKFTVLIFTILWLTSCDNTYKANKNYIYTFQGSTHKDNLGRKVYGGHHFILDEPIQDMASFKECYVKYLEWSGLDKDGEYKKAYYRDDKNIYIYLFDETWGSITVESVDLCN